MGRTLEDSDGGGEVVDSTGGLEGGDNDGRSGDEIVGEGVVQVALRGGERLVTDVGVVEFVAAVPEARKHPGQPRIPSRIWGQQLGQQLAIAIERVSVGSCREWTKGIMSVGDSDGRWAGGSNWTIRRTWR